jgi:hypothetical protein
MEVGTILPFGIAALAILVPLIMKILENHHQRYLKKLEVMLNRKLDAYFDFLVSAANFSYLSSKDGIDYQKFLEAQQRARIVASDDVSEAIRQVSVEANRLRGETDPIEKSILQSSRWYDAMELSTKKMHIEIKSIVGKLS